MTGIELRGLTVKYGGNTVIDRLSAQLESGKIFVLLGVSGSGKSTILKTIAGLLSPAGGSVLFDGIDVTTLPPGKREVGFVPQHQILFPNMSIWDNIAFGLKVLKLPRETIKERVNEIATLTGVTHLLSRNPDTLSGGERQRVSLARALAPSPKILLLDEPFSSLDEGERLRISLIFKEIQQELGITAIHVTHSSSEAEIMGDTIGILDRGKLIQAGSFQELKKNPLSLSVASLLGIENAFDTEDLDPSFLDLVHPPIFKDPFGKKFTILLPEWIKLGNGKGYRSKVVAVTENNCFVSIGNNKFLELKRENWMKVGEEVFLGKSIKE